MRAKRFEGWTCAVCGELFLPADKISGRVCESLSVGLADLAERCCTCEACGKGLEVPSHNFCSACLREGVQLYTHLEKRERAGISCSPQELMSRRD